MNQFAKRLQSRLSAKGHRFSMEQCRQAISTNAESPVPTEDEMTAAFNWLLHSNKSTAGELATVEPETEVAIPAPQTFDIPVENMPYLQPPGNEDNDNSIASPPPEAAALTIADSPKPIAPASPSAGGITQTEITQAITQAVAQVGASGNAEAIELLTSLANELSTDIKDVEEMASSLITAYLGKRQNILASAIGTVQSLRSAQTSSFQAGLDQNFFDHKERNKRQFLNNLQGMFN